MCYNPEILNLSHFMHENFNNYFSGDNLLKLYNEFYNEFLLKNQDCFLKENMLKFYNNFLLKHHTVQISRKN